MVYDHNGCKNSVITIRLTILKEMSLYIVNKIIIYTQQESKL